MLKDYDKKDLRTFSAVYGKGKRGDESEFINEYNRIIKNMSFHFIQMRNLFIMTMDDIHNRTC